MMSYHFFRFTDLKFLLEIFPVVRRLHQPGDVPVPGGGQGERVEASEAVQGLPAQREPEGVPPLGQGGRALSDS